MEKGRWFLWSCPFFWTVVGRFDRQINFQSLRVEEAIYFTRTGATFDVLCRDGLVTRGDEKSQWHGPFAELFIPAHPTLWFPWSAPTPWSIGGQR